jgi:hypothetical protein
MRIAFDRECARAARSRGVQGLGDRVEYAASLENDTDRPKATRRTTFDLSQHEIGEWALERDLVRSQEAHCVCEQPLSGTPSSTKRSVRGVGFKEVVPSGSSVIDQGVDDRVAKICKLRASLAPLHLLGR